MDRLFISMDYSTQFNEIIRLATALELGCYTTDVAWVCKESSRGMVRSGRGSFHTRHPPSIALAGDDFYDRF